MKDDGTDGKYQNNCSIYLGEILFSIGRLCSRIDLVCHRYNDSDNNEYEFPFYVEFNFIEGHEKPEYLNIEHLQSDHRLNLSNKLLKRDNIDCVT